jgi:hypothetical protein
LVLVIKEFIFSKIQDCQFNHQRALYAWKFSCEYGPRLTTVNQIISNQRYS